jgi:hypothetical protein
MLYSWEIEEDELESFIKEARKRYLKSVLDKEIAENTYYEIIKNLVTKKLGAQGIGLGTQINISFDDEECPCVFRGINRGKIKFTEFTKKKKLCKRISLTDWDMWEHIQKI